MIYTILSDQFLRQIPPLLQAGIKAKTHAVYGSTVRDVATGRIAGFLQETELGAKLLKPIASVANGLSPVDLVGHTVSYVQNEQIKAGIQTLQSLQSAGLALSMAGIGVSIAGFAILNARIGRLEDRLRDVSDGMTALAKKVESLRHDRVAEDFARLRTVAERLEEGWLLADPIAQWRGVAESAHLLGGQFERRCHELLDQSAHEFGGLEPFVDALALSVALRVKSRLAAGDDRAALGAATDGANSLAAICDRIKVGDVALARMSMSDCSPGTSGWQGKLDTETASVREVSANVRSNEAAAISTVGLVETLALLNIQGHEWIKAARSEEEAPFLFLSMPSEL